MKTLKVLLQEVVSGIKAWVNSNFAQESNAVHKTGNETVNGVKTFTGNVVQNQAGGTNVYCATCDGVVKGDLTSSGMLSIVCKDGSNANMENSGLAAVYMGQDTSGSYVSLRADTSYNNTRYNASVSLDIDPTTANNNAIFRPRRDNTIDLGSSSYQFKNLYAKNYYYNGVAWGLDKQNEWTNFQRMICNPAVWYLRNNTVTLGTAPSSNRYSGMFFEDVNGDSLGYVAFQANKSGINSIQFNVQNSDGTNTYATQMRLRLAQDGYSVFIPETDNTIKLGDSGNHWKDCYTYLINGVNPGALSFPNVGAETDFSGDVVPPTGESGINISGGLNTYTPEFDGWISIRYNHATIISVVRSVACSFGNVLSLPSAGEITLSMPVIANVTYHIRIIATETNKYTHFYFTKSKGDPTNP